MATREKKTAPEAEEQKETAPEAEEQVTISTEKLRELENQIKLLSNAIASEDRLKTAQMKKAEEDALLIEEAKANYKKAFEKVKIHIDRGNLKGNRNAEVAINGKQYLIPKGVDVEVPRCVAEVIANAEAQKNAAYAMQEEKSAEFVTAEAQGAFNGGFAVN